MNGDVAARQAEWLEAFELYRTRAEELLGGPVELLMAAPVLYQGWELDQWMWLVKCGEAVVALGTNHGQLVALDRDDIAAAIARYEDAERQTRALLDRTLQPL